MSRRSRERAGSRIGETSDRAHESSGPGVDPADAMQRAGVITAFVPIFLASGATSLVYETVWARHLHLVFGTSQLAICTVLAAFMAGLALGGFSAARWAGRVSRPLLAYAALEAFIGAYALAFPIILSRVSPLYLGFWRAFEPSPTAFGAFQLILLGTLLLPPTICMGATLPLLARFVTARPGEAGHQVGRLYGANTLGAVLGTAMAGFVMLPKLGLAATTLWAAACNGALALAAVALSRMSVPIPPAPPPSRAERDEETSAGLPFLLIIAGLAGFSALLCEVAWFRLMVLILGGSAYSFSIMLLSFLLGIGIGGWVGGPLADRSFRVGGRARLLRHVAWMQGGVAVTTWGAMFAYGQLPFIFVWLYAQMDPPGSSLWTGNLLLALGLMLPPALLMGATFSYLVRAAAGTPKAMSRPVGLLYGMNTLGAIAGSAAGGLLFLPTLHVRGTVLTAVSINLAAGMVAWGLSLASAGAVPWKRLGGPVLAAVLAIALVHWQKPPWQPLLMTAGMYEYVSDLPDYSRRAVIDYTVTPFKLLFYDEGLSSVVTVAVNRNDGDIWLANNGKVDASTRSDLDTEVLLAHLPLAFQPDAERVLVIGLASGITTGSITLHQHLKRIDVAELEPVVVNASRYFDDHNYRPLEDPRVHLHLNDARNHLMLTPDGTYDLVSSEPSNPWLSGVSNLFTREFFALGKRKLREGGVWAQWLHGYEMSPKDLKSLLATFADVYPYVRVFQIDASDLILLGSETPMSMKASAIDEIFRRYPAVARDLGRVEKQTAEDIVGLYLFSRDAILSLAGDVELNTDDNMRIEYSAPLHKYEKTEDANTLMLRQIAETPLEAVDGREGLVALAKAYASTDPDWRRAIAAIESAAVVSPDDPEVRVLRKLYKQRAFEASQ